jgi:hypothetical protein
MFRLRDGCVFVCSEQPIKIERVRAELIRLPPEGGQFEVWGSLYRTIG